MTYKSIRSVRVRVATCRRCDHEWILRKAGRPAKCPGCSASAWDRERVYKTAKGGPPRKKKGKKS